MNNPFSYRVFVEVCPHLSPTDVNQLIMKQKGVVVAKLSSVSYPHYPHPCFSLFAYLQLFNKIRLIIGKVQNALFWLLLSAFCTLCTVDRSEIRAPASSAWFAACNHISPCGYCNPSIRVLQYLHAGIAVFLLGYCSVLSKVLQYPPAGTPVPCLWY